MRWPKIDFHLLNHQLDKFFWIISILIALIIFSVIFSISFQFVLPCLVAFYWNWILSTDLIEKKAIKRKYAFSFIRFANILNSVVKNNLSRFKVFPNHVTRGFSPFIFFAIVFFATGQNYLIESLIGSGLFEFANKFNTEMLKGN